ncbi:MAG: HAD-IA family hydrolase [Candidatus Latescibacteria bacterium]|nr:HAD-IA family hydrolase [Candidatus Latescibacterota bacterium]
MEPEQTIEAVLFDLGGVLIELGGVQTMLDWTGDEVSEEELWARWLHSPAVRAYESGAIGAPRFAQQLIAEMDLRVGPEDFLDAFRAWPVGLYSGALELVASLPDGYIRAALSNSNDLHWPRFMDEMGLDGAFDHCFASHLLGQLKPDRAVFDQVVEVLDCPPEAVLFLDDNRINIEGARAAGLQGAVAKGVVGAERVLQQWGIV